MEETSRDEFFHYHFNDENSLALATHFELEEEIHSEPIEGIEMLNLKTPFLVFGKDGYGHHMTFYIMKRAKALFEESKNSKGVNKLYYIHIDSHKDYESQAFGVKYLNFVHYIHEYNLVEASFWMTPAIFREEKKYVKTDVLSYSDKRFCEGPTEGSVVYVSIDVDFFRYDMINHRFPHASGRIAPEELRAEIEGMKKKWKIIGADITGYSDFERQDCGKRLNPAARAESMKNISMLRAAIVGKQNSRPAVKLST